MRLRVNPETVNEGVDPGSVPQRRDETVELLLTGRFRKKLENSIRDEKHAPRRLERHLSTRKARTREKTERASGAFEHVDLLAVVEERERVLPRAAEDEAVGAKVDDAIEHGHVLVQFAQAEIVVEALEQLVGPE